ncbi:MAG: hypothetical protein GPJ50_03185 [Candidatus Heimdallarchaeota archaeon]|nr:hypothetical protein [Candidatus Heimdallarchaeota archaeon]
MIQIKDSSTVPFENNLYDTIILDPPYMPESEFKKFSGEGKNNQIQYQKELYVYTEKIQEIEDRISAYARKHTRCWVVVFENHRNNPFARYHINWMKERGGLGGKIRRNTEYIHIYNYAQTVNDFDFQPAGTIDETLFIPRERNIRACSKPVKLFEKTYEFLGSKKVLDLFAGWENSVVAAYNLGLEIDAYDIDSSLQERYSLINSMGKKKQLTLGEVVS